MHAIDHKPADDTSRETALPLFGQYRPSHRLAKDAIQHTQWGGGVTLGLALLFVWAFWGTYRPLNWAIAGLCLGFLLLLRGALKLPETHRHRLAITTRLTQHRDRWFPLFLFMQQTVYLFAAATLIWFALPALGVPLHWAYHLGLYLMITFISIRRLINEWVETRVDTQRSHVNDLLRLGTTIVVTLLIAIAVTHAISPLGHPITGDNSLQVVFVWSIAIFVIISAIILLTDRLHGRKRGPESHGS